ESIMLPMLAYREQARAVRGITAPEMVVPDTIHPAFEKGAYYFGIRLVRVPVGADFLADVEAMRAAITPDTIALAGSAANYPHGLIDPLARLSEVALAHGIGMHVDACLGGFLLPWIEKLGYDVPPFDFRLPGVVDIYHVADHMASRGWRLNGLQRPPGFHICVTLPQTAPGLAERFVEDLRAAVTYAKSPPASPPKSGALYGGGSTGMEPAL